MWFIHSHSMAKFEQIAIGIMDEKKAHISVSFRFFLFKWLGGLRTHQTPNQFPLIVACVCVRIQSATYANSLFQTFRERKKKSIQWSLNVCSRVFSSRFYFFQMYAANVTVAVICLKSVFPLDAIDFNMRLLAHSHGSESKAAILIEGKWKNWRSKKKIRTENTMNGNDSVMLLTAFCAHTWNDSFAEQISQPQPPTASADLVIEHEREVHRNQFRAKFVGRWTWNGIRFVQIVYFHA